MIDYIKLYEEIDNPLTDEAIAYLVDCFSKGENLYVSLTKRYSKEKTPIEEVDIEHDDFMYETLFSSWRHNVLSLSESEIQRFINIGLVQDDYYKLVELLKDMPPVKTKEEYDNLLKTNKLIYKYGWQCKKSDSSWVHVDSSILSAWRNNNTFPIEHRLYLNCNPQAVEKIAYEFISACKNRNLPFYFKFKTNENRDDTIVIYSSTKNLSDYIEILKFIRLYNKELFNEHVKHPPLLTGNIDGWLGYGSENRDLKRVSFNDLRYRIFNTAIDRAVANWVYENRSQVISFKDKEIRFYEYLNINLTNRIIRKYKKLYQTYVEQGKENRFFEEQGITKEELDSEEFRNKIYNALDQQMISAIFHIYKEERKDDVTITVKNFRKITITDRDFKGVIRGSSYQILTHYPELYAEIRKQLAIECQKYNVDYEKFCFDTKRKNEMFNFQKKRKK